MGCNNPTEGETKVVETTKVVEVPAADVPAEEVEDEKETKISIGEDGGSIETEDVEIKINE